MVNESRGLRIRFLPQGKPIPPWTPTPRSSSDTRALWCCGPAKTVLECVPLVGERRTSNRLGCRIPRRRSERHILYPDQTVKDRGSYLLLVTLANETSIQVGRLARIVFPAGYHIYVGSAMANLSARLARHRRKTKNLHWHIDYLTAKASRVLPIPIPSSAREECEIANALSSILQPGPAAFGSSDCGCVTHLFFAPTNPLKSRAFRQVLQRFRMGKGER